MFGFKFRARLIFVDEHVDQASFRLVGSIEASVISDCRLAASSVLLSFLLRSFIFAIFFENVAPEARSLFVNNLALPVV